MHVITDHHDQGSDRLAVLFEQWVGCEGHWRESALYQRLRVESRFRKRGCRKWLTVSELAVKYGSSTVADKIKIAKESDPECANQRRPHPDAPNEPVSRLSWVVAVWGGVASLDDLYDYEYEFITSAHIHDTD